MPLCASRRRFLLAAAASATSLASGCGTFLYPERLGQPRTGPIDWKVVALDGIGLILFVVPGAIAFAVDWYTGTLFLPQTPYYGGKLPAHPHLVSHPLERHQLTRKGIEEAIRQQTGQSVVLEPGTYRTQHLQRIDQFAETVEILERDTTPNVAEVTAAS